ncbi:hypothetical protein C8A03DRAFT_18786 [Achaetomium macrosporum]|uniref:Uncharacterized protein n=1 Tax=Achaetomium macrosporum TaxID=79813 RepID=A0AAN7C2Q2_9PEZI|nr:hypothetical protein C8A03DRAFT_18786 [Achaetomium macrosporum]
MWGFNLRSQPSRPPPPFDPVVEAWLDSLPPPSTTPSSKELRQWRLSNYHGLGRSVFLTCIVLRAVSLAIALAVTGIIASVIANRHGPSGAYKGLVPVLVVCPIVAFWNTAEFIAACIQRDGGICPNVHVLVDTLLFLGMATGTGILLVDFICGLHDFPSTFESAPTEIASVCLLIVLMVIHSFFLFFFIWNYVDGVRRRPSPDDGHLPTIAYPRIASAWHDPVLPADKATPSASPEPQKLDRITTTELDHSILRRNSNIPQLAIPLRALTLRALPRWPLRMRSGESGPGG